MKAPALALALLAGGAASAQAPAFDLEVRVVGVVGDHGKINVAVCTRQTFRRICPYIATAPARPGLTTVKVPGVPAGQYAVRVIHDTNGNGRLDRLLRIAREGYGFSRQNHRGLRTPDFDAVAFRHDRGQSIVVQIRYIAG